MNDSWTFFIFSNKISGFLVTLKKLIKDISIEKLVDLVECYRDRKFDEDIQKLKDEFGGMEGIADKLKTSLSKGLLGDDLLKREVEFGTNKKDPPERAGLWNLWLGALDDLMLKILIVWAVVSMIISLIFEEENKGIAWIEGGAILLAVFLVSGVTAWNDHKKEEQFFEINWIQWSKEHCDSYEKWKANSN